MDPEKIKSIVKKNFDESAETYSKFEEIYSLFTNLTKMLSEFCEIKKGMNVLDVGCGAGASTSFLSSIAEKVLGIDLSEGMIAVAQENKKSNTEFMVGDGENLSEFVCEKFDAVLYNASIFLMPNPKKTLESAKSILKKNGVCGASYLYGLVSDGEDIMEEARKNGFAQDGTFVRPDDIRNAFHDVFGTIKEKKVVIPVDMKQAEEFYSIPAQSASLFPKISYEERIPLLKILFSHIEERYGKVGILWGFIRGTV